MMHPKNIPHLHEKVIFTSNADRPTGRVVGKFDCFRRNENTSNSYELYCIELDHNFCFYNPNRNTFISTLVAHHDAFEVQDCTCGYLD